MKISECKHIRIRDNNAYGIDVHTCLSIPYMIVSYIETQYDMDIRSLPQWQDILKRFQVSTTDCKRIIQNAKRRKQQIIKNLYTESTRLSPFQLTENLARTSSLWKMLERQAKRKKIPFMLEPEIIPQSDISEISFAEQSDVESGHQNTEATRTHDVEIDAQQLKSEPEPEAPVISLLPVYINTNLHELVGTSSVSSLTRKSEEVIEIEKTGKVEKVDEWTQLPKSLLVKSLPEEIIIKNDSLEEQVMKFSIVNRGTELLYIKFICVTEKSPFRYVKIIPNTPTKLYPGLSIVYKFMFKVVQNEYDFTSSLYFRIGQIVLAEGSTLKSLCIPVKSNYIGLRNVAVSKAVYLPPVYPWHVGGDCGYPTRYINVSILDNYSYRIHINKRNIEFDDTEDSTESSVGVGPESSEIHSGDTNEQSKYRQSVNNIVIEEPIDIVEIVSLVLSDIIEASLEPFWIENTHLYLPKFYQTSFKIPVHLTKVERIGSHHACYDVYFIDPYTEKNVLTKTVKVFGQVLAHPIEIHPPILDMSNSPVTHGFCEDKFTIVNTHKFYCATVKIKMTSKMKNLLNVYPMEVVVPQMSSVKFDVRFCCPGLTKRVKIEDLVHFTIKVIVTGPKAVYHKVPPFFYEIIAPCYEIYEKVYGKPKVET